MPTIHPHTSSVMKHRAQSSLLPRKSFLIIKPAAPFLRIEISCSTLVLSNLSTSRGQCIREDGDFNDLGRVGLATRAAANMLSKTRLIDAGHAVSYDADADVYHLDGAHRSYAFSRKITGNGYRSSHYSCDMAAPSQTHALIATFA